MALFTACCSSLHHTSSVNNGGGNLHSHHPPREYLGEYISRGKLKILPADRILMDPGHKARKNPSDNADLGFQAIGPALRIVQLNVEGLSAHKKMKIDRTHYRSDIYLKNEWTWSWMTVDWRRHLRW